MPYVKHRYTTQSTPWTLSLHHHYHRYVFPAYLNDSPRGRGTAPFVPHKMPNDTTNLDAREAESVPGRGTAAAPAVVLTPMGNVNLNEYMKAGSRTLILGQASLRRAS
ncbi:hypothetical protein BD311DRAFT_753215 [Dichomitus squalens]|uniref:Uncharacterized protein n=1 Tax=Dichomitus squalens TaxID=114155 RepID=A0A4Q9MT77_9APHY|nr:hypothetical protein BD311DRAFT_753215 [Dichomitus squalens]TBU58206.1 hypothetical protein BD310DRAFT_927562 [Dichomitus squalens]